MTVLVVTGTDTGVGKTVVTAALAAAAASHGLRVAVIKPAQTGIPAGDGAESDEETIVRLAAPASVRTLATFPDPLAPLAAARECGRDPLAIGDVIEAVTDAAGAYGLVLVEGAGGLLVPMGGGWTVADLAMTLGAGMVVVARAGLGTLNHTALTLEALNRRHIRAAVVIGAWPSRPELVHWTNLADLAGDLAGILPDGLASLPRDRFVRSAPAWFTPRLWGSADAARLRLDGPAHTVD